MNRWTWAVAAALLAACGSGPAQSSAGTTGGEDTGGDAPPSSGSGTTPCDGLFTVRLAGANLGEVQQVELLVGDVDLGATEPTFVASGTVSFPVAGAHRIAVAPVPPGGGAVDVTLRLGGIGLTQGGSTTSVDTCSAPISFRLDTANLSPERCHAVLVLDLARSVAAGPDGPVFLPHYTVHY